jgi:hypothetical protein
LEGAHHGAAARLVAAQLSGVPGNADVQVKARWLARGAGNRSCRLS